MVIMSVVSEVRKLTFPISSNRTLERLMVKLGCRAWRIVDDFLASIPIEMNFLKLGYFSSKR